MGSVLNLLIQSSNYYAPFAGVMLTSLFENNREINSIKVYLLTKDMSEENKKRFEVLARQYDRTIVFLDCTEIDSFLENNFVPKYKGSYTAYYKIFALSLIKGDIDKLVYMDADIIVDGSLSDLVDFDLRGNILGMCIDVISEKYKKLIGQTSEFYYNTGMIVFDVKKWNDNNCAEKIVNHIKNVHSAYPIAEQDIVNLVLGGRIQTLPLIYNMGTYILVYKKWELIKNYFGVKNWYSKKQFEEAKEKAIVFHCFACLTTHPWAYNSKHPLKDIWNSYLLKSPWADFPPIREKMSFPYKIQYALFYLFPHRLYAFIGRTVVCSIFYCRPAKKMGIR